MELNLSEILKNVSKGTKLYCTLFGEVIFDGIQNVNNIVIHKVGDVPRYLDCDGKWFTNNDGECILFPSKDNRDWSTFKIEERKYNAGDYLLWKRNNSVFKIIAANSLNRYDLECITTDDDTYSKRGYAETKSLDEEFEPCDKFPWDSLKPFDRVLVRFNQIDSVWKCALFSHLHKLRVYADTLLWDMCVPYNDDTKHLIGTTDEAPEFYKQ